MTVGEDQRQVLCLVCGEVLPYMSETTPLIAHLKSKHPNIQMARLPVIKSEHEAARFSKPASPLKKYFKEESKRSTKALTKEDSFRMYKKSIASWRPGNDRLLCPKCGIKTLPVVRRINPLTSNPVAACCLMGLFPLCIVPYFLSNSQNLNLYCAHCSVLLGTYDRKLSKCLQSPHFVNVPKSTVFTTKAK